MKLYASLTSPYARKIRILCVEKKIKIDFVEDVPWDPATRVPNFNPLGKVPVLVCDDGEILYDSPVIAAYMEIVEPNPAFLPAQGMERIRVRLLEALADGIMDAAAAEVVEGRRPEHLQSKEWVERQRGKVNRGLDDLERRLGQSQWMNGTNYSLADVAVGCALAFIDFRLPNLVWRKTHPNLTALAERLLTRESFIQTKLPGTV